MQSSGEKQPINYVILAISLLAVLYNCILAFINHNITPLTPNAVVMSEVLLQVASFAYILKRGFMRRIWRRSSICSSRSC